MSRAYLLLGGNGQTRQEKMAEIYGKTKSNQNPQVDPDTQILTDPSSIKIEDIRSLEHSLSLKPYLGSPKVVLIPEAEKLTFEAQGAMLKLLEEPPGETVFVLATPNAENLLPTIVSRCQVVNLPPESQISLSDEELKDQKTKLKKILQSSPGERIKVTENIQSREEVEKFCRIQLVLWREILLENPTQQNVGVIREIQKTLKYLAANVNPRLALENLLLGYPMV